MLAIDFGADGTVVIGPAGCPVPVAQSFLDRVDGGDPIAGLEYVSSAGLVS
jgi:hypothetical protein